MKKFFAMLLGLLVITMASLSLAAPASATVTAPSADNKKIEICHATGNANNPYNKIEVSVISWLDGHKSHRDDIWTAFSYTTVGGTVVNVPAQGNTALLAFDECVEPKVDTVVAVPAVNKVDNCGILEDSVTPVRDDSKYTTVVGPRVGDTITVVFTALDGFVFTGGQKVVQVQVSFPNNADCDLPETGGAATYNTLLGGSALAGVIALGAAMLLTRKRVA